MEKLRYHLCNVCIQSILKEEASHRKKRGFGEVSDKSLYHKAYSNFYRTLFIVLEYVSQGSGMFLLYLKSSKSFNCKHYVHLHMLITLKMVNSRHFARFSWSVISCRHSFGEFLCDEYICNWGYLHRHLGPG